MDSQGHIDLIISLLTHHTWTSATPKSVHEGGIPDVLQYPAIGVVAGGGRKFDETLDGVEFVETVDITVASPQGLDGTVTNQRLMLAMKQEIVNLILANPYLGDASKVRGTTVESWDRTIQTFEREDGDEVTFDYVTVRYSVRYAVALS